MIHLDGAPLMVHALINILVLSLMLFACIGACAKKQRLLYPGLLLLSISGFLWAALTTYPSLQAQLAEASPFLYRWFVPISDLIQAAGWGCLALTLFKSPKSA